MSQEGAQDGMRDDGTQEDGAQEAGGTGEAGGTEEERSFEECLGALEAVVERIESGELNLEESLATFEEGVGLIRVCNRKLGEVERRVEVLTRDADGRSRLQEFVEEEAAD